LKNQNVTARHLRHTADMSGDINEVFPNKVCINLNRRPDRWEQMRLQFDRHDIRTVRRFPAVDGQTLTLPPSWLSTAGAYGCLLSHLQVVREARDRGQPSVLIFEDDVVFNARLRDNFRTYISQLPVQWDMLHFGAMHLDDLIEISANVYQIRRAYSTYAYALNHTIFDAFIELNSKAGRAVDHNNHVLQAQHACYCFVPHLAWVESNYSDVQERHKHPWYIQESLVIHGSDMGHLLSQTSLIMAYRNPSNNKTIMQNLLFLTRFYSEHFPGISIVIVEQDAEPTINSVTLPEGCEYSLVRDGGPLNRGLCFNVGMGMARPNDRFLVFSDSDIFMEEWDIRGNLRMCQEYDCATGFRSLIELTTAGTLKLQSNEAMLTPWFDAKKYARCDKTDAFSRYCVFNRRSILATGGWEERGPEKAAVPLSTKGGQQLRVFESPNDALRLHHE